MFDNSITILSMQQKNDKIKYLSKITGTLIKKLRQDSTKSSLNTFALEVDLARGNMSKLESGFHDPKLSTLWKIAEGLDMPLSTFIKILEQELPKDWELLE